jgi:hypothetical protein
MGAWCLNRERFSAATACKAAAKHEGGEAVSDVLEDAFSGFGTMPALILIRMRLEDDTKC